MSAIISLRARALTLCRSAKNRSSSECCQGIPPSIAVASVAAALFARTAVPIVISAAVAVSVPTAVIVASVLDFLLLLVLVAGIYLAADPGTYRKGFLLLFPASSRSEASEMIGVVFASLRLWLVGQLLGMLLVGVLSATGLWLLGMPSALALGVIAGLFEFVPILGPFIAAVPAVATGFAQSQEMGFWVVALYVLIQQVEGNLITPLIQQRMVKVPPALTLFAVVGFALMFGLLGAIGAMPLLVVLFVVIKKVWIKETLDEEIHLPGEAKDGPTANRAAPAMTPD